MGNYEKLLANAVNEFNKRFQNEVKILLNYSEGSWEIVFDFMNNDLIRTPKFTEAKEVLEAIEQAINVIKQRF